jgi:hypothetical protein
MRSKHRDVERNAFTRHRQESDDDAVVTCSEMIKGDHDEGEHAKITRYYICGEARITSVMHGLRKERV